MTGLLMPSTKPIGPLRRAELRRDGQSVGSWDAAEDGTVAAYLPRSLSELVGCELIGIRPDGSETRLAAWRPLS